MHDKISFIMIKKNLIKQLIQKHKHFTIDEGVFISCIQNTKKRVETRGASRVFYARFKVFCTLVKKQSPVYLYTASQTKLNLARNSTRQLSWFMGFLQWHQDNLMIMIV